MRPVPRRRAYTSGGDGNAATRYRTPDAFARSTSGAPTPVAHRYWQRFHLEHCAQRVGRGSRSLDVLGICRDRRFDGDPHGSPVLAPASLQNKVRRLDPGVLLFGDEIGIECVFNAIEEVLIRFSHGALNQMGPPECKRTADHATDFPVQEALERTALEISHVDLELGDVPFDPSRGRRWG